MIFIFYFSNLTLILFLILFNFALYFWVFFCFFYHFTYDLTIITSIPGHLSQIKFTNIYFCDIC